MSRSRAARLGTRLLLLAAALGGAPLVAIAGPEMVTEALREELASKGSTVVIVGLKGPSVALKDLAKPDAHPYAQVQGQVALDLAFTGMKVRHEYQSIPYMIIEADGRAVDALARHPSVVSLASDTPISGQMAESILNIRADAAQSTYGVTGAGVTVAVMDTGVDYGHPELVGSVIGQQRFLGQGTITGPSGLDDHGHGTQVAGILTADGVTTTTRGVAPGVQLVSVKILDSSNSGYMSDLARGLDWLFINTAQFPGLAIVNMSLGDPSGSVNCPCDAEGQYAVVRDAVNNLYGIKMILVAAAGNAGFTTKITAPGCLSNVISVGSTFDASFPIAPALGLYSQQGIPGFASCADFPAPVDTIPCFSNRSPCLDYVAPGYLINSPTLGGAWFPSMGTSFSAPHVSGIFALLRERGGKLISPAQYQAYLDFASSPVFDPATSASYLKPDALVAVGLIPTPAPPRPVISDPGDVIIGDQEEGIAQNVFAFPDAFDLLTIVDDESTSPAGIIWSFTAPDPTYKINGVRNLIVGDNPINPPATRRIDTNDLDTGHPGQDALMNTATFRNESLSPTAGSPPYPDPAAVPGIINAQTRTITLIASNGTTATSRNIQVYTANDAPDALSGALDFISNDDFENDPLAAIGWLGGVILGGGATGTSGGLCMTAPLLGDNIIGWVSPDGLVGLVDGAVYRVRSTLSCSQTRADSIPLLNIIYQNFYQGSPGTANIYGGVNWVLDVDGGGNGIGRVQGRQVYDTWFVPNAFLTDQWRGVVDPINSPFTPTYDASNDFAIAYRLLDLGSAGVASDVDSGSVCVRRVRIESIPYSQLSTALVYGPPINSAKQAAQTFQQAAQGAGTAAIDDLAGIARYQLTGSGAGSRKTLLPNDISMLNGVNQNGNLYPVDWNTNQLYLGLVKIRSNVAGGAGPEGTSPVDAIFLNFDTTNSELGSLQYTTHGGGLNMLRAASPRLASTTGGVAQTYAAFFHGQNTTLSTTYDPARLRFMVDFFNTTTIGAATDGTDPMVVEAVEVRTVDLSAYN